MLADIQLPLSLLISSLDCTRKGSAYIFICHAYSLLAVHAGTLCFHGSPCWLNTCCVELSWVHSTDSTKFTTWAATNLLDSCVGRAPHQYQKGHGFESCSNSNIFPGFIFSTTKFAHIIVVISCVFGSFSHCWNITCFIELFQGCRYVLSHLLH